jgi:two-component system response regulator
MSKRPIQMLLAEDNASEADLILASLAKVASPDLIHVVRDGVQTLDFVFGRGEYATYAPKPCLRLILLDVKLPKVDGFEVLSQLKTNHLTRCIPVVMLTSSNIERDVARGYDLGANSYLQKPVDFERFRETIRQLGLYWMTMSEPPPAPASDGGSR